jgi:CHAD domain-containing protein
VSPAPAPPPRPADLLLDRPAAESARRVALAHLARALAARRALAAGDDPEALHDLRVAVRRLRSTLRAYGGELGSAVGRKLLRRLRRLARATNPLRDAEVGLARLARWRDELPESAERRAAAALAHALETRLAEGRDRILAGLPGELDTLAAKLGERLATWRVDLRPETATNGAPTLRARVGEEFAAHGRALDAALAAAAGGDASAAHRARIEAKRLRYLLEPLSSELDSAAAPLRRLRALQDLLGELNDLAVLAHELAAAAGESARKRYLVAAGIAPRARPEAGGRGGRLALVRRIAGERARLEQRVAREWLGSRASERTELKRGLAAVDAELAVGEGA